MPRTIAVASSTNDGTALAIREVAEALSSVDPRLVLVFYSPRHDAEEVAKLVAEHFPGAQTAGCSTMGEIGVQGVTRGGVSAFAIGGAARAAVEWIEGSGQFRFQDGAAIVGRLTRSLGMLARDLDPERHILITLTDGLSNYEELLVASLAEYAPAVPLVGGSAGDDLRIEGTTVFANRRVAVGSAAVILLEPDVPTRAFARHHFSMGDEVLVVTEATPDARLLSGLNGWPAVREYARLTGIDEERLRRDPQALLEARVHFAFRAGGETYMRGVMALKGDSLVLGGAVEEGMVLHVARAGDLLGQTRRGVDDAILAVGGPANAQGLLLFSCGGRLQEALAGNLVEGMWEAMTPLPAAGFCCYGEQFGPVQVNFTLAGIAFGAPGSHVRR